MVPYFQFTHFNLGPITIQVWGLCVALGLLAALLVMHAATKKYLLSSEVILDVALWIMVGAFTGARFFYVVFYNPGQYVMNPVEALRVWHGGLSSLGGFIGALGGLWLFAKKRKFTWHELLPYMDVAALGLWLGWGIGRIGCFFIHDHPGTLSHFVLAVRYPALTPCAIPDGSLCFVPRHDLGLYESLVGFILFITYYVIFPRLIKKRWGLVAVYSSLSYAVIRFFLDFLRANDIPEADVRYALLTPAQWGMLAVMFGLTFWLIYGKMRPLNAPK